MAELTEQDIREALLATARRCITGNTVRGWLTSASGICAITAARSSTELRVGKPSRSHGTVDLWPS